MELKYNVNATDAPEFFGITEERAKEISKNLIEINHSTKNFTLTMKYLIDTYTDMQERAFALYCMGAISFESSMRTFTPYKLAHKVADTAMTLTDKIAEIITKELSKTFDVNVTLRNELEKKEVSSKGVRT